MKNTMQIIINIHITHDSLCDYLKVLYQLQKFWDGKSVWKEAVVIIFKVLSSYLPRDWGKPQDTSPDEAAVEY
jgi:hypothetical protein